MGFSLRPAGPSDIPEMHRIRTSVVENRLSDPSRITERSYLRYLRDGAAWVAEEARQLVGFAILDARDGSVWALFVDPASEGRGIGSALHAEMLSWAEANGFGRLTLTTSAGTRAETFYLARGWRVARRDESGETRLELALG